MLYNTAYGRAIASVLRGDPCGVDVKAGPFFRLAFIWAVDEQLGIIRVTRVVNAVAAGRIINTKTAASQIMGSVVWGIGMALHEETLVDHNFGRIMNANIAEYHVPVNADVQDIKMIFVDEPDSTVNTLGIAAIANAVYHATGKRVRDLPITIDKIFR